jgi:hypothetical protein
VGTHTQVEVVFHAIAQCREGEDDVPDCCKEMSTHNGTIFWALLTSCGGVLAEVSSLISAEQTRGSDGRCGALGELFVEFCYPCHADGIFGGSETLRVCQLLGLL